MQVLLKLQRTANGFHIFPFMIGNCSVNDVGGYGLKDRGSIPRKSRSSAPKADITSIESVQMDH